MEHKAYIMLGIFMVLVNLFYGTKHLRRKKLMKKTDFRLGVFFYSAWTILGVYFIVS